MYSYVLLMMGGHLFGCNLKKKNAHNLSLTQSKFY